MSDPTSYLDSMLPELEPSFALPTQHTILGAQYPSDETQGLIELGNQVVRQFQTFDNYIQSTDRSAVTALDISECGKGLRRLTEAVGNMEGLAERYLRLSAAKLLLITLAGVLNRPGDIWASFQGQRPHYVNVQPDPPRYKHLFLNLIGDPPSAEAETRGQTHFVLDDLETVLGDMEYNEDEDLSQMVDRISQRLETLRDSTPGATEGAIRGTVARRIDEYIERLHLIGNQG